MKGVGAWLPWAFLLISCKAKIPAQLIMTGKPETVEEMPEDIQANIKNTLALSKGMKFRWFGDKACRQYIKDHYDKELVEMFDSTREGYYRGDICRSAVMYNEGGFYLDVDVEMAQPVKSIAGQDTTFASAYAVDFGAYSPFHLDGPAGRLATDSKSKSQNAVDKGDIFNAVLATEPKSDILFENLQEIRRWRRGESKHNGLMGTQCLYRALQSVLKKSCGASLEDKRKTTKWTCGQHKLKMFREDKLLCNTQAGHFLTRKECGSQLRQKNKEIGMQLGLFPAGQSVFPGRFMLGWSRFGGCKDDSLGCGSGGHVGVPKKKKHPMSRPVFVLLKKSSPVVIEAGAPKKISLNTVEERKGTLMRREKRRVRVP